MSVRIRGAPRYSVPAHNEFNQERLSDEDLSRALNYVLCVSVPFFCITVIVAVYIFLAPNVCDPSEGTEVPITTEASTTFSPIMIDLIRVWENCSQYLCLYPYPNINICNEVFKELLQNNTDTYKDTGTGIFGIFSGFLPSLGLYKTTPNK